MTTYFCTMLFICGCNYFMIRLMNEWKKNHIRFRQIWVGKSFINHILIYKEMQSTLCPTANYSTLYNFLINVYCKLFNNANYYMHMLIQVVLILIRVSKKMVWHHFCGQPALMRYIYCFRKSNFGWLCFTNAAMYRAGRESYCC